MNSDWIDTARSAKTAEDKLASLQAFRPELMAPQSNLHPFDAAWLALGEDLRAFLDRVEQGVSKDVTGLFNDDEFVRTQNSDDAFRAAQRTLELEFLRYSFGLGSLPEWNHNDLPGAWIARATSGLFSKGVRVDSRILTHADRLTILHQLHFAISCEPMGRANQPWVQRMRFSILWAPDQWIRVITDGAPAQEDIETWLPLLLCPMDRAAVAIVHTAQLLNQPWLTPKHLVQAQIEILRVLNRTGEKTAAMEILANAEKHAAKGRPPAHSASLTAEEPPPAETARAVERASNHIRRQAKPALRLVLSARPLPQDDEVVHSEFGGAPSLPPEIEWPHFEHASKHYPMRFWCQLNLAELPHLRSTLPSSGWLIFFSGLSHIGEHVPARVIYSPTAGTTRTFPPSSLPRFAHPDDAYSEDPRRFLPDDDSLSRLEFRRRAFAAPVETYPDSEDGSGVRGWTFNTPYEEAYRALASLAEERADRILKNIETPGSRTPYPQPRLTKLHAYLQGAPYTWADVLSIAQIIETTLRPYTAPLPPGHAPASDLGADAASLASDGVALAAAWIERAAAEAPFTRLDDAERENALSGFSKILRRADAIQRARIDLHACWKLDREASKKSEPARKYWAVQSASDFRGLGRVAPFNLQRAIHNGKHVEDLYPAWLIDAYCPSRDVIRGSSRENTDASPASIHHQVPHQMLGWGASVQAAPAKHFDKVMLLQIGGGDFAALGNASSALQFWIAPRDLKSKRFDRAFATLEFN